MSKLNHDLSYIINQLSDAFPVMVSVCCLDYVDVGLGLYFVVQLAHSQEGHGPQTAFLSPTNLFERFLLTSVTTNQKIYCLLRSQHCFVHPLSKLSKR